MSPEYMRKLLKTVTKTVGSSPDGPLRPMTIGARKSHPRRKLNERNTGGLGPFRRTIETITPEQLRMFI